MTMPDIHVPIIPRKMDFDLAARCSRDWLGGDPVRSAFMNGISLALPLGEHFFIRSVRQFDLEALDPSLQEDIRAFIAQEAIHSRQHERYNQLLVRDGHDITTIEQRIRELLDEVWESSTPLERLAVTIALEHFTHVLGDQILSHPERLNTWDNEYRAFWLWHAAEEIEHKSVCYDLYRQLGGSYLTRTNAMLRVTARILAVFWQNQHELLAQFCHSQGRKMYSFAEIQRANAGFIYGRQGILRGWERSYADWFRPSFHPWSHDNRRALETWRKEVLPLNYVGDVKVAAMT